MQDDCPGERRSRELWRFNGVLPRRLGVPEDRKHGRVRVAVGAIERVTEPSRKSYHPPRARELLRPVEGSLGEPEERHRIRELERHEASGIRKA